MGGFQRQALPSRGLKVGAGSQPLAQPASQSHNAMQPTKANVYTILIEVYTGINCSHYNV
eukprot:6480485-Amphidinium_carterae.4